jgi:hypothetical protein
MKLIYLTSEGIAFVEDMRPYKRFVEVRGGDYHPLVPGAVMQDDLWTCPPMMFIWQNVRWPEGAEGSDGTWPLREADHAKEHFHPVSVSKRWVRALLAWFLFFIKMAALGFVVALSALIGIALMGGF